MTRDKGFKRGDLDPAFPIDDKFLALRKLVSAARYYGATGVYFHMAAATWREAERKPAAKVCPDALEEVADLMAVGLLDKAGRIPLRAYSHTVARANVLRQQAADRKAKSRDQMSRGQHRDGRVTDEMSERNGTEYGTERSTSSLSKEDARVPESLRTNGWRADDSPRDESEILKVIDYLQVRTGRMYQFGEGSRVHECLSPDVRDFGADVVIEAMTALTKSKYPDIGELVFGASRRLHRIESPSNEPPDPEYIAAQIAIQREARRKERSDA